MLSSTKFGPSILVKHICVLCLCTAFGLSTFSQKRFTIEANDTLVQSAAEHGKMIAFFKDVKLYQNDSGNFDYDANIYLSYASSGLTWAQEKGSEWNVLEAQFYKLRYSYDAGKYDQAFTLASDLLSSELFQADKRITRVTSYVKKMHLNNRAYIQLLEFFPTYDRMNRKHGRVISKSDYINDQYLGNAYYGQKNYGKAIEYFKKRASIVAKSEGGFAPSSYNDIGLCFKNINEWDSANFYFDLSLAQLDEIKRIDPSRFDSFFELIVRSNRADYFVFKGEHNRAMPIYRNELIVSRGKRDGNILPSAYYNVAKVLYLNNDLLLALAHIDSAISTGYKRKEFLSKCYYLKAKCLAAKGNKKNAEVYFNKTEALKDSLELNRVENSYIMASTQYDLARKENDLLLSTQKVKEGKIRNRLTLIGLISFALLAFLSFVFYRKARKAKIVITHQKGVAVKDAQEKSLLLKEVHHRVKNNLQVISGLLDLQRSKNKDAGFGGLVEDTQKYIHSMSLVHEMLYQKDQISSINIQEYLTKLSTFAASSQLKKNVEMVVDAQDIELSLDKATPLGLVLTELISNSYKHAFNADKDAVIFISMEVIGEKYHFKYSDNGIGLPTDFSVQQTRSLGFRLIRMFAEEMNAQLTLGKEEGFALSLDFTN